MPFALPAPYRWLASLAPCPRMLAEGVALFGTAEAAGTADDPTILGWARETGCTDYRADAQPWCGLFLAVVAKRAGKPLPAGPLWALNWRRFGSAAPAPALGDVLIFRRAGGGHVALYVGEDAAAFHVLGGNQGDRVGIARVARERLVAARRPSYRATPITVRPVRLAATGALSEREA